MEGRGRFESAGGSPVDPDLGTRRSARSAASASASGPGEGSGMRSRASMSPCPREAERGQGWGSSIDAQRIVSDFPPGTSRTQSFSAP